MAITLDRRELATALAALRYWQREGLMSAGAEQEIATCADEDYQCDPLNADEIDDLCERMNGQETEDHLPTTHVSRTFYRGMTIEISAEHRQWVNHICGVLRRIERIASDMAMGGISSSATRDECVTWILEGKTVEEQRKL